MNTSLTRKKFLTNSGIAVAGMLCGCDVLRAQPGTEKPELRPEPRATQQPHTPLRRYKHCAASTRQRSYADSSGYVLGLGLRGQRMREISEDCTLSLRGD